MTANASRLYYSNMANISTATEGWTQETQLLSFSVTHSAAARCNYLEAVIGNPANNRATTYTPLKRILLKDRRLGGTGATDGQPMFLGRIDSVEPTTSEDWGSVITIKARDYMAEMADAYVNKNYIPTWGGANSSISYMVRDLVQTYCASARLTGGPLAIPSLIIDNSYCSISLNTTAATRDFRNSTMTVLEALEMLNYQEPRNGPPATAWGYEFYVYPYYPAVGAYGAGWKQMFRRFAKDTTTTGLTLEWGGSYTDTARPIITASFPNNTSDLFTRVTIFGKGPDVFSTYTDATKESTWNWGGGQWQTVKERIWHDPSVQNVTDAAQHAQALAADASSNSSTWMGTITFPDPPANITSGLLAVPGWLVTIVYPPANINGTYVVREWVYREPECMTTMTVTRRNLRETNEAIVEGIRRGQSGQWRARDYYESGQ